MFLSHGKSIVIVLAYLAGLAACTYGPSATATVPVTIPAIQTVNTPVQARQTSSILAQATRAPSPAPGLQEGDPLHPTALSAPAVRGHLQLFHTIARPLISQQEAIQIVTDSGSSWSPGMHLHGNTVTVKAVYGLATYKLAGTTTPTATAEGSARSGECDNPLSPCFLVQRCHAGQCISTGKFVGPLHNRPVWLLDYGNILFISSQSPADNHDVYLVDAIEKFVLKDWTYQGP